MADLIEHCGVVERTERDTVYVRITSRSACGTCKARQACGLAEAQDKIVAVATPEAGQYAAGREVMVGVRRSAGVRAVVLAYVGALAVLLAVLVGTIAVAGWSEGAGALAAIAGVGVYYFALWLFRRKIEHTIYNNKNLMEVLLYTILTLCALGVFSAVILYFVARKFRVEEDPRIDEVEKMLPGANCGGCGFAGCRGMADALVKRDDISALFCPVGGGDCMKAVAAYLGKAAAEKQPEVATVRCGGTCEKRPRTNEYNGAKSCAVASSLYVGETGCAFGCLGFGDCVAVCAFDAIHINPETGLPEVDADKCTACGACVKACPKMIIELRKKWPKNRAVYVSCVSKDKGAVVMKACKAGCIGCGKCVKVCAFDAITVENNLAYIDPQKCKLCRKCVNECPTGAIRLVGMDPLPKAPKAPAAPAANKES